MTFRFLEPLGTLIYELEYTKLLEMSKKASQIILGKSGVLKFGNSDIHFLKLCNLGILQSILDSWNLGVLESLNFENLKLRNFGTLELRNFGTLKLLIILDNYNT